MDWILRCLSWQLSCLLGTESKHDYILLIVMSIFLLEKKNRGSFLCQGNYFFCIEAYSFSFVCLMLALFI